MQTDQKTILVKKLKKTILYQLMISLMLALAFSYIFLSDNKKNGLNIKDPTIISIFAIFGITLFIVGMIFLVAKTYEYKKSITEESKDQEHINEEYNYNRTEYEIINSCFYYFALTSIATSYFFIVHHFIDNILSNDSKFNPASTKNLIFLVALIVMEMLTIISIIYTVQSTINANKEIGEGIDEEIDEEIDNQQSSNYKKRDNEYLIGSAITLIVSICLAISAVFFHKENVKLLIFLELISAMFIISSLAILCMNINKDIPTPDISTPDISTCIENTNTSEKEEYMQSK